MAHHKLFGELFTALEGSAVLRRAYYLHVSEVFVANKEIIYPFY